MKINCFFVTFIILIFLDKNKMDIYINNILCK